MEEVVWEVKKNEENIRKHGVDFEIAKFVFNDMNRLERVDRSECNYLFEDRYQTLGAVGRILFVVYTDRQEKRRLISARIADKEERRIYYAGGNKKGSDWRPANA